MRFTSVHSPNLTFFPKDGNTWRVDWYGDVSFPDRRQSYKQPSVTDQHIRNIPTCHARHRDTNGLNFERVDGYVEVEQE